MITMHNGSIKFKHTLQVNFVDGWFTISESMFNLVTLLVVPLLASNTL